MSAPVTNPVVAPSDPAPRNFDHWHIVVGDETKTLCGLPLGPDALEGGPSLTQGGPRCIVCDDLWSAVRRGTWTP